MIVEFMCYGDLANVLRTNSGVLSLQQTESPSLEMVILSKSLECLLCWNLNTRYFVKHAFFVSNIVIVSGRFIAD